MRTIAGSFLVLAGVLLGAPVAAGAADLPGRVEAVGGGRPTPGQASRAVVWFEPDEPVLGATAEPDDGEPPEMITRRKEFTPRVLVVPEGATVAFPNRDPILHNVFSVSEPRPFDLGLYGRGEVGRVRFPRAGVVRIFCNVHHDMVGYVVVLDTPCHGRPEADGRFRLTGLPPGPGTLRVWHEQAEPFSARVEVPEVGSANPVTVPLDLERPRIPPHLDKFGRSYRERRGSRYRGG